MTRTSDTSETQIIVPANTESKHQDTSVRKDGTTHQPQVTSLSLTTPLQDAAVWCALNNNTSQTKSSWRVFRVRLQRTGATTVVFESFVPPIYELMARFGAVALSVHSVAPNTTPLRPGDSLEERIYIYLAMLPQHEIGLRSNSLDFQLQALGCTLQSIHRLKLLAEWPNPTTTVEEKVQPNAERQIVANNSGSIDSATPSDKVEKRHTPTNGMFISLLAFVSVIAGACFLAPTQPAITTDTMTAIAAATAATLKADLPGLLQTINITKESDPSFHLLLMNQINQLTWAVGIACVVIAIMFMLSAACFADCVRNEGESRAMTEEAIVRAVTHAIKSNPLFTSLTKDEQKANHAVAV